MAKEKPTWPLPSTSHATRLSDGFKQDLKDVASTLASHDRVDQVSKKHVDDAFNILSQVGLRRVPWWKRPELETGVGAFFIGAALACPDVLPVFFPQTWLSKQGVTAGAVAACFVVGSILSMRGWYRGRLPR